MKSKVSLTMNKDKKNRLASSGKIIVAVLLIVISIPLMGTIWVKDGRQNPSYCANCHESPYYNEWIEDNGTFSLANQHSELGISCQTCHDRTLGESISEIVNYTFGNYHFPIDETQIPVEVCLSCHQSYATIIPLTDPSTTGFERNPHDGHWGELECGVCHNMHRDSEVYCDQCHDPMMVDEPGWVLSISN